MKVSSRLLLAISLTAMVLAVAVPGSRRVVAQTATDCIRICTEVPLRVVLENVARIVGEVKITNDSESPVPTSVEGPVQVANSPRSSLATKISMLVADIFQKEVSIVLPPGTLNGTASFDVPPSKLLVIEGYSGFAQMGSGFQFPAGSFTTIANGSPGTHMLTGQMGGGGYVINSANWGNIYADPGSPVQVFFHRIPSATGTATLMLTFTGHYIDQ